MSRTPARGFPPVSPVHPGPGDDGYAAGYGYSEGGGQRPPGPPVAAAPTGAAPTVAAPTMAAPTVAAPTVAAPTVAAPTVVTPVAAPVTRRHGAKGAGGRRPRRRSRIVWLAVAVVAVIAGGAFAGYRYLYEPRVNAPVPSSLRLPTTTAQSPDFDKALGKWQHIGTRAEDPVPLTLAELYPPGFTFNGSSFVRAAASLTKDCTTTVYGTQLQAALQSGQCTQVLRASYISGTMMGTIGVVNLSTASAAQAAGKATGPEEIIAPLSSQKGPTSKLGTGTGVVQAEIKGHYLILMWAEFTDLKSPSTQAQRQQLEQFAANMVTGSANIDLSTRMLTGKAAASS